MGRFQRFREKVGIPERLDLRDFSEGYVRLANGVLLVLSLVILGFGAYLVANLGDSLSAIELSSPAVATVVFGVFLFIFSCVGLAMAISENKILQFIYVIGCTVVTVCILAAGAALLSYTSFFQNVEANNLQFELEEKILAYELAIFEVCCFETNPAPRLCSEAGDLFPCFADRSFYEFLLDNVVGETTCGVLSSFEVNGAPLVSRENSASCGGQDMKEFVEVISEFIAENIQTLGTINLVLAFLMFLLLAASCHMLFTRDKDDREKPEDYEDTDGKELDGYDSE